MQGKLDIENMINVVESLDLVNENEFNVSKSTLKKALEANGITPPVEALMNSKLLTPKNTQTVQEKQKLLYGY